MKFQQQTIVASNGIYGPFKDDEGGPDRSYAFVDLLDTTGGGVLRATCVQGLEAPAPLTAGLAELELYSRDNALKLRLHSFAVTGTVVPGQPVPAGSDIPY